ncbi:MAG: hypothetical protein ACK4G2_04515 [Novosphingobium sp.]
MNGGTRIIPIEGADRESGQRETGAQENGEEGAGKTSEADDVPAREAAQEASVRAEASSTGAGWIGMAPAVVAAAAIAAWTAFFVRVAILPQTEPILPQQWAWWISQWAVPVLLVMVALLLFMRTSRKEAARFADVAAGLSRESERLEQRLLSINTELSLARDFVAAQSRDLETLGRVAVERLSANAGRLEDLVSRNGMQVEQIAQVSTAALDNMEKLRGQLPVIANAAKDVTNNIGNAGRTAHLQLEELVSGFQRLNEFGLASERQVNSFRERVDAALARFSASAESLAGLAEDRFEALSRQSADHLALLSSAEQKALDRWQERSAAQTASLRETFEQISASHEGLIADAADRLSRFEDAARALTAMLAQEAATLDEELARRRADAEAQAVALRTALDARLCAIDAAIEQRRLAMEQAAAEAADALAARLAGFDQAIDAQRTAHLGEVEAIAGRIEEIADKIRSFSGVLRESDKQGAQTAALLDKAMADLNARLGEVRHALSGTDLQLGELTDSAVRLLELIQAGSEHTRTQMPEALRSTEAGLKGLENRIFTLRDTLREAGDGGRTLSETVGSVRSEVAASLQEIEAAQETLASHAARRKGELGALRQALADARSESETVSASIEARLGGAIAQLADAAAAAGQSLQASTAEEIEALARTLGDQTSEAMTSVLRGRAAELVGRLEEAIDAAAAASRDTVIEMRDQLTKVDELAANLEARVRQARERAEEQVDNDFARRAALITESLNSSAIDIAKALSAEVSETAWASYLRGDRGIFTRRAVSLLENAEAKAVQAHYETDGEFREHVNRYIHDFEAMLRQLLSTRDGNALGVTLLSSDMGKLYVALAQGIERLRT